MGMMQELAEAAEVDPSVLSEGVRAIELGLFGKTLAHPRAIQPIDWERANERLKKLEMRRVATDLLNLGLRRRTVYWVLLDLHPEENPRVINSLVRRQSVRIAGSPRGPD